MNAREFVGREWLFDRIYRRLTDATVYVAACKSGHKTTNSSLANLLLITGSSGVGKSAVCRELDNKTSTNNASEHTDAASSLAAARKCAIRHRTLVVHYFDRGVQNAQSSFRALTAKLTEVLREKQPTFQPARSNRLTDEYDLRCTLRCLCADGAAAMVTNCARLIVIDSVDRLLPCEREMRQLVDFISDAPDWLHFVVTCRSDQFKSNLQPILQRCVDSKHYELCPLDYDDTANVKASTSAAAHTSGLALLLLNDAVRLTRNQLLSPLVCNVDSVLIASLATKSKGNMLFIVKTSEMMRQRLMRNDELVKVLESDDVLAALYRFILGKLLIQVHNSSSDKSVINMIVRALLSLFAFDERRQRRSFTRAQLLRRVKAKHNQVVTRSLFDAVFNLFGALLLTTEVDENAPERQRGACASGADSASDNTNESDSESSFESSLTCLFGAPPSYATLRYALFHEHLAEWLSLMANNNNRGGGTTRETFDCAAWLRALNTEAWQLNALYCWQRMCHSQNSGVAGGSIQRKLKRTSTPLVHPSLHTQACKQAVNDLPFVDDDDKDSDDVSDNDNTAPVALFELHKRRLRMLHKFHYFLAKSQPIIDSYDDYHDYQEDSVTFLHSMRRIYEASSTIVRSQQMQTEEAEHSASSVSSTLSAAAKAADIVNIDGNSFLSTGVISASLLKNTLERVASAAPFTKHIGAVSSCANANAAMERTSQQPRLESKRKLKQMQRSKLFRSDEADTSSSNTRPRIGEKRLRSCFRICLFCK